MLVTVPSATAPTFFFSVGEPSGDLHASNLIKGLAAKMPAAEFRGFGGDKMANQGCKIDFDLTQLAVVGFVEVVPKLREFFRVADIASDIFKTQRPSAVIVVDFPGFNWHIAKRAKEEGIPVFYYLPPQLWAWGSWRVEKVKKYVDHVFCNLPFEADWYAERGVSSEYVGHPFFDEVADRDLDQNFLKEQSQWDATQVAVLPGSRRKEVKNIWPIQLATIRELASRHPKTRFQVACLRAEHETYCRSQLTETDSKLNIKFHAGKASELIELADCALMKSGSASLEMMARGTPTVVVYHVGRLLYGIVRTLTGLTSMTLPNLLAEKVVMPEFLAVGSPNKAIEQCIASMDRLLSDPLERRKQAAELANLCEQFAQPGASKRTAARLLEKLEQMSTDGFQETPTDHQQELRAA